jgi:hypothetical protein
MLAVFPLLMMAVMVILAVFSQFLKAFGTKNTINFDVKELYLIQG